MGLERAADREDEVSHGGIFLEAPVRPPDLGRLQGCPLGQLARVNLVQSMRVRPDSLLANEL